jgi:hypothetical protein
MLVLLAWPVNDLITFAITESLAFLTLTIFFRQASRSIEMGFLQ